MPLSLFVSGFFFPIGVLLYWVANNLWTLGQQFFILRKLPPPGSDAHKAKADADKPVRRPADAGAEARRQAGAHARAAVPRPPPRRHVQPASRGRCRRVPDGPPAANGRQRRDGTAHGAGARAAAAPAWPRGQGPANRGKRKRR